MNASARVPAMFFFACLLFSSVHAQQWQQTGSIPRGSGITALAVKQSNGHLYATTGSFNWPNADTGGVHVSTDRGNTWTRVFTANIGRTVAVKSNGIIFAGVRPVTNEGLYYSSNDGQSWQLAFDVGPNNNVFAVAFDTVSFLTPNVAYAGTRSGFGVHRNTGGGIAGSWTTSSQGLPLGAWILALAIAPLPPPALYGMALAGVMNPFNGTTSGVYYSTNQGQGWSFASGIQSGDTVTSLIVAPDSAASGNGRFVLAGTSSGRLYRAYVNSPALVFSLVHTFQGEKINAFAAVEVGSPSPQSGHGSPQGIDMFLWLAREAGFPFANATGADSGGVSVSLDYGLTWQEQNQGISAPRRMSSATVLVPTSGPPTLFAGKFLDQNSGGPVFKLDVLTDVDPNISLPDEYVLHQNYPNPFNPTTAIRYQLSAISFVSLRVFDLLGREVATLVNEARQSGRYEVTWDATGFASGVYFYRLDARPVDGGDPFRSVKKMLMIK